jgi:hypothetical protein
LSVIRLFVVFLTSVSPLPPATGCNLLFNIMRAVVRVEVLTAMP